MALLALLLLVRLGATPIYILDEAKNAQCAREMLQRGDWIVPTFNNELRTDKPPLHYFFMMAAYSMFGVNEFAARFFSAVMGLLTVLVTYLYTKKHTNAFTAFCSASVLILSTHFLFEFRLAVPDPYLIFFSSFFPDPMNQTIHATHPSAKRVTHSNTEQCRHEAAFFIVSTGYLVLHVTG